MELKRNWVRIAFNCACLLIVPYGIETFVRIKFKVRVGRLLIVPYGIETSYNSPVISLNTLTFNRTLWN